MSYRKHYMPLESNPTVFTELAHSLGLSTDLEFHDILSLDDIDLLVLVPPPTLALVLAFPASSHYETELVNKDKDVAEHTKSGEKEDVIWYRQTINNACGLYGILHTVSNGAARDFIDDEHLESAYKTVALQGCSEVPANPEVEVDYHYVCFVKSHMNGHLYELDGDRKGPIDWGQLDPADDLLSDKALGAIRKFIRPISYTIGFSLLTLAPAN